MNVTFAPKGILQIDDARIIYRNFKGAPSKYNREGDRNFAVVIDDEKVYEALIKEGWNAKWKEPREDGEPPFMYLPVKMKFNGRGPVVYLKTNGNMNRLGEEEVGLLDNVDIVSVDMDIRPYDWGPIGPDQKYGRSAYLQSICVTQQVDRFAEKYGVGESTDEPPFDEE